MVRNVQDSSFRRPRSVLDKVTKALGIVWLLQSTWTIVYFYRFSPTYLQSTVQNNEHSQSRVGLLSEEQKRSCVYATLMCADDDLVPTLVLLHTIQKSNTSCDLTVLCPCHSLSSKSTQLLVDFGAQVMYVKDLDYPFRQVPQVGVEGVSCQFLKLHLWNITGYTTVIFLNSDTILTNNVDNLLNCDEFCAADDMYPSMFSSDVMVLRPDPTIFQRMLLLYRKVESDKLGEQRFLNYFWGDVWKSKSGRRLSVEYNFFTVFFNTMLVEKWEGGLVNVVHYASELKPWTFYKLSTNRENFLRLKHLYFQRELFFHWIKVREEMLYKKQYLDPLISELHPQSSVMLQFCQESQVKYFRAQAPIEDMFSVLLSCYHRKRLCAKLIRHYQLSSYVLEIFLYWHDPLSSPPSIKQRNVLGRSEQSNFQAVVMVNGTQVMITPSMRGPSPRWVEKNYYDLPLESGKSSSNTTISLVVLAGPNAEEVGQLSLTRETLIGNSHQQTSASCYKCYALRSPRVMSHRVNTGSSVCLRVEVYHKRSEAKYRQPREKKSSSSFLRIKVVEAHNMTPTPKPIHIIDVSGYNSLVQRFAPVQKVRTDMVLLLDDDIRVPINDLDFAFAVASQSIGSLVGPYARTIMTTDTGSYYDMVEKFQYPFSKDGALQKTPLHLHLDDFGARAFSLVLTKFLFARRDYLWDFYCLSPPELLRIVEKYQNGEDIAFNMFTSAINREVPVVVEVKVDDFGRFDGISTRSDHYGARNRLTTDLIGVFGWNPLIKSNIAARGYRGYTAERFLHLDWYDKVDQTKDLEKGWMSNLTGLVSGLNISRRARRKLFRAIKRRRPWVGY